jgi:hypothetical protein
MYINKSHGAAVRQCSSAETGLHRAPPELWPRLGGEEVRGPSYEAVYTGVADTAAVSAGAADSAAVETLVVPPVPGVQKPSHWVGKRFRDRFAAAPLLKV